MVEYVAAVKGELAGENEEVGRSPSTRKVAERTGIPRTTASEAQSHVETADAFPFMQSWPQYRVLEARELLAKPGGPAGAAQAPVWTGCAPEKAKERPGRIVILPG